LVQRQEEVLQKERIRKKVQAQEAGDGRLTSAGLVFGMALLPHRNCLNEKSLSHLPKPLTGIACLVKKSRGDMMGTAYRAPSVRLPSIQIGV
jgi:hypothetical protein